MECPRVRAGVVAILQPVRAETRSSILAPGPHFAQFTSLVVTQTS